MPLVYRLAADTVVAVHVAYLLFVIVGLLVTLLGALMNWRSVRNPWFRGVHLAMIGIVVFETWWGITCPLTVWEWRLRELAGETTYQGDFIANGLHNWLFYDFPPWVFSAGYSLFGLAVLATWIWLPPRWKRAS